MLKGQRVSLRRLDERDLAAIMSWDEDEEIIAAMGKKFHAENECANWFAAVRQEPRRRVLAIDNEDGELIGELELDNLSPKEGAVELSICIGNRAYWNQGYGTDAISLIRDHIFASTRLRRIYLRVYRSNKRAIRCYEKCGFTKEAVLPLSRRQSGRHDDVVLMSITRARYLAQRGETTPYCRRRRTVGE
ncbi:MAG: GNAT family N-acetyltransferase [Chloroflexota bacterium]